MTGSSEGVGAGMWNYWRIARWSAALVLLLTPLVMMQISNEWHWGIGSFVLAGIMIGGCSTRSPSGHTEAAPTVSGLPSRSWRRS